MTRRTNRRTTNHWRVGRNFCADSGLNVGECVSVTLNPQGEPLWVRLRFPDGSEKSYPRAHVYEQPKP